MVFAHLHRINADANMARFYHIALAANLFGETTVLRTWGRIGTQGRTSVETCASPEDAEQAASRTLRQKIRRGYVPDRPLQAVDVFVPSVCWREPF